MNVDKQAADKNPNGEDFFSGELVVANVGIRPFYDSLEALGIRVYQVDWTVPAGGDQQIMNLLDKLLGEF